MRTGYKRETWEFGSSREVEEKHTGRYGARGQKRQKRRKPTKEEITKQNQWKRERDVRRLIKWNFVANDYWMTITRKERSLRRQLHHYIKRPVHGNVRARGFTSSGIRPI